MPPQAGPAPAALTHPQPFSELMATLRERFSVVILDAPTLAAASRALQLGPEADAILFVARWGHTTRQAAAASIQRLAFCGLPVRAILLNQVPPRAHRRLEPPSGSPVTVLSAGIGVGRASGGAHAVAARKREAAT